MPKIVSTYWRPQPDEGKHHVKVEMIGKFGICDRLLYFCPVRECGFHEHYGLEVSEEEKGTGIVWCCGDGRGVDKDG
jgi:hypothetical protein